MFKYYIRGTKIYISQEGIEGYFDFEDFDQNCKEIILKGIPKYILDRMPLGSN